MPMERSAVTEVLHELVMPDAKAKWNRNKVLRSQLEGDLTKVWMPPTADGEYKDFMRKARAPWLMYGAQAIAQGLIVDGHTNPQVWEKAWEGSGMGGRQSALNEEIVSYGYGYLLSLPSEVKGGVFMRPLSVHSTFSVKEDPWDDQPQYVIHQVRGGRDKDKHLHRFFDDEAMYTIHGDLDRPREVQHTEHGLGMNPVTLIQSQYALDGLPGSVVEGGLSTYHRIVDATFTVLMVQRYGAFPQKWMTGGLIGVGPDGKPTINVARDNLLHVEDELAKFGAFPAEDLDKIVAAKDSHIQDLAALLQIPPHYFLGKVVNLSSDAVAAIETGYHRRNALLQESMAEGYEQSLRVASAVLDLGDAAQDTKSSVHWAGTEVWSLAEVADAVVKLNSIGAPREKLFQMVPGWDAQDAQSATNVAIVRDRETQSQTESQSTSPATGGDAVTTTANTSGTTE